MSTTASTTSVYEQLADALQQELTLLNEARRSMTMFSGHRTGSFAGRTYYRFEVPEEILLQSIEVATFTFGRTNPLSIDGNVIDMENQFLTVALPQDFGPNLPEVQVSWDYQLQIGPVIDRLKVIPQDALIPKVLLQPGAPNNAHAVPFEPIIPAQTPPDQATAVTRVMQNAVSLVWGPILSGKSRLLALIAANYLKGGKSVLFVAPSNGQVDDMLLQTTETCTAIGMDASTIAARYDLPSLTNAPALAPYSFEQQVEHVREEKRKVFQERVMLLKTYWDVQVKQILHEDFYKRVQEMRNVVSALRKRFDSVSAEVTQAQHAVTTIQNASILDRMKKGFSKEDLAAAQKVLTEKQQMQKQLLQLQKQLSNEITNIELHAPITAEEIQAQNAAVKRMNDLGGFAKVAQAVEEYSSVDQVSMLNEKRFLSTSVATALMDPAFAKRQFDMVIIDDVQAVNLPTLTALATMAKEKLVLGGDPFQNEPDTLLSNETGRTWLQRDVFLALSGTERLDDLFAWAENNKQWCIFLSSHFASTPKLSLFASSVLFQDKINVFASPKAKGRIFFIDTTSEGARCRQYVGKKRIMPYNELHTARAIECIKHAFMDAGRTAGEIGVILPFVGPTLYTKQQIRTAGMRNIEVGTPQTFRDRRKKAIIFDLTMAGVDYTMRPIDERKTGEYRILRLINTALSCVVEDLYVIADLGHLRTLYKDRFLTRLLLLLHEHADQKQPVFYNQVKAFDAVDPRKRATYFSIAGDAQSASPTFVSQGAAPETEDLELKMQMKLMAKKELTKAPGDAAAVLEKEVLRGVERILGMRMDINLLSLYVGGELLFRNSHSSDLAAETLPQEMVANEKDFQRVMESWHLLIYEMSGGNKTENPFLTHKGTESRARQDIKSLRSFYSADISAVISEGRNKIAGEVGKIFQDLIGKPQPANPAEWSKAYLKFLGRVEAYLTWLSGQIRGQ